MPESLKKASAERNQETGVLVLVQAGMWGPAIRFSLAGCDARAEEGRAGGRSQGIGYGQAGCWKGDPHRLVYSH